MTFETLDQLVATFAARGELTAIVHCHGNDREVISYAELGAGIHARARGLRARGVGPGDRVALWAPNSIDWVNGYFAVVCTGATAVPIDYQSTADSAAAALRHATPRTLLTTSARAASLTTAQGDATLDVMLLDGDGATDWRALLEPRATLDLPAIHADDIASLLFTSGTTGTPKAVPLTHANLAANANALLAAALVRSDDRVLLPLPLHHTYPFTVGLLTVLARGATVVLPAGLSGPEIAHAATTENATALLAVPRLCAALWDSVQAAVHARSRWQQQLFALSLALSIAWRRLTGAHLGRWLFRSVHARLGRSLAVIGCGGAQLPTELAWQLEGLGWTVLTGYGLTETSPVLTFNDRNHSRLGSEGRALAGIELRIDAPPGAPSGEIDARGRSVFTGYWQNATATAVSFTADGWFRTGDLGRFDADGYLYVVGRSKELIVLPDGKKLFPDTIEALYAASPLFREIAILELDGRLAALIVPDERTVLERGALREAALLRDEIEDIAARLPPYQRLASYCVTRTPLPRTQLGKLKRHLLPALYAAAADGTPPAADPVVDERDRALVGGERSGAVWAWLQQRYPDRPLTLDTSPQLDLKIDSLEWVTLTIEIERRFGVALTDEALSRILTLRDLLRELEAAEPAADDDSTEPTFEPPGLLLRALGAMIFVVLRPCVRLLWRLEVDGAARLPQRGPLLITPNHASYLDPLALAAALPWRQLRRTYWAGWVGVMYTSPLRRLLSRAAQVFPIDPDRDLGTALRTARQLLARGQCVVWFPEGRRSPTGRLEPFQDGVGVLLENGVTAVPTAILGTFAAWPKHRRRPRLLPLQVRFGTPHTFADPAAAIDDRRDALEQAVCELLEAPVGRDATERRRPEGGTAMPTAPAFATEATLHDGRRVVIRPIGRDDVARNAAFLDALSPPSKHFLFLGGIGRLSEGALQRLCDPDHTHDMAYIALVPDATAEGGERQIGVCRYAGAADTAGAEISVAVADDWQHQGLGQLLLRRLIDYAREHGVTRLYSMDAVANDRMRRLARHLGFVEQPDPDDIHQVIYSLPLQRR